MNRKTQRRARALRGVVAGVCAAVGVAMISAPLTGCDDSVGAGTETAEVVSTLDSSRSDDARQADRDDHRNDDRDETATDDAGDRGEVPAYDQVSASDEASGNEPYEYEDEAGGEPEQTETVFKGDQLEQMVSPIALYPDSLMMQILMASTYPTEVVLADQWVKENRELTGEKLDAALAEQTWDDSVKSLVRLPDVLSRLASNLDWTRDLGDAFLAQKDDVLNSIQVMRNRACDLGNLKTTAEQKVIREPYQAPPQEPLPAGEPVVGEPPYPPDEGEAPVQRRYEVPPPSHVVRIEPVTPQVVHVPIYSPRMVYGPPPATLYYPAVFAPSPGYVATAAISFGVGITLGAVLWSDVDWYHRRVLVRRYPGGYYGPGRYYGRGAGVVVAADLPFVPWRHSYRHRRGIAYRSPGIARRYSVSPRGDALRVHGGGHDRDKHFDKGRGHGSGKDTGKNAGKNAGKTSGRSAGSMHARGGKVDGHGGGKSVERSGKGGSSRGSSGKGAVSGRGKSSSDKGSVASRGHGPASGSKSRGPSVSSKGSSKSRGPSVSSKGSSKSRGPSVSSKGSSKSRGPAVSSKGSSKSRGPSMGSSGSSGRSSTHGSASRHSTAKGGKQSGGGHGSPHGGGKGGGRGGKGGGKH